MQQKLCMYGPSSRGPTPLCNSLDGTTLIQNTEGINARWKEHFQSLLNRNSAVTDITIESVPQHQTKESLADLLTINELQRGIKYIKNNKATGPDGIPAEVFGVVALTNRLYNLIVKIWRKEMIPPDLRNATIVTIFKKGDKSCCGNYRGISLLSIAGKILSVSSSTEFSLLLRKFYPNHSVASDQSGVPLT